jgi:phosphoglycerol transferase MdoB-like AlkP superfamily enzyme
MLPSPQSVPDNQNRITSPSPFWPAWTAKFQTIICNSRFTPLLFIGVLYLFVSFLLRIVLFVAFGGDTDLSTTTLLSTLGIGIANDTITLGYLLAPLTLYLLFVPCKMHQSLPGRLLMAAISWIAYFGIFYQAVAQYFFFKEFTARFNLVAVDYLIYPHEVFVNIYESYHVISICALIAIYASLLLKFSWKQLANSAKIHVIFSRRFRFFLSHATILLVFAFLFSTHSFDFSTNRIVNEIAVDGISSFFEALRTNHLDYHAHYKTEDPHLLAGLLQTQLATDTSRSEPGEADINRVASGSNSGLGKLNVVVIVEESFGCEQVDACGNGKTIEAAMASSNTALTPKFDVLAMQGLFFNRAYATGTRTVRGLEAITASLPPIPSESIIKRPGNEHIATWGKVMAEHGYHTSFLYGGFSAFDNMQSFYSNNGFAISDRLDIQNPKFSNIWGVSDQDLFDHARLYFDHQADSGAPFFSIIMTTSNHSPYTFPEGIEGVRSRGGSRRDGIRYADHALGEFLEKSKRAPWYTNTLSVVVADHGARVYGSQQFPLQSYEIPLLIMAPGHLQPRQINSPISQIDIAPTVLGLLGLPYNAPFFGQNVFAQSDASKILLFNHNHDVALYQHETLTVLGLGKSTHTYGYRLGGDRFDVVSDDRHLTDLAIAYYQTAFDLFTQHKYL